MLYMYIFLTFLVSLFYIVNVIIYLLLLDTSKYTNIGIKLLVDKAQFSCTASGDNSLNKLVLKVVFPLECWCKNIIC